MEERDDRPPEQNLMTCYLPEANIVKIWELYRLQAKVQWILEEMRCYRYVHQNEKPQCLFIVRDIVA